jgi:hypothetical protein
MKQVAISLAAIFLGLFLLILNRHFHAQALAAKAACYHQNDLVENVRRMNRTDFTEIIPASGPCVNITKPFEL